MTSARAGQAGERILTFVLSVALLPVVIVTQDDLDALARRAREQAEQPSAPKEKSKEERRPVAAARVTSTRAMKPGTATGIFIDSSQLRSYANRRVPSNTWLTGQFTFLNQKEGNGWVFVTTAMLFFRGQTRVLVAFPHGKQSNLNRDGLVAMADRNQPFKLDRVVEKNGVLTVYATNPFSP